MSIDMNTRPLDGGALVLTQGLCFCPASADTMDRLSPGPWRTAIVG